MPARALLIRTFGAIGWTRGRRLGIIGCGRRDDDPRIARAVDRPYAAVKARTLLCGEPGSKSKALPIMPRGAWSSKKAAGVVSPVSAWSTARPIFRSASAEGASNFPSERIESKQDG